MEKLFKLKANGTDVKTEVIGGVTTFFAMAYIIFVNPSYLSQTGMPYNAVLLATCISAAIGCFLTAFLANLPFAMAPGMGLNAFFTYTICGSMGYTWQEGLAIVFLSGVLFLIIAVSPLRSAVIASLPKDLKAAISAGIGLFICLVGLLGANVVVMFGNWTGDGAGDYCDLGNITSGPALVCIIGILITAVLYVLNVKGSIFLGILASTVIGIPLGVTVLPEHLTASYSMSETLFVLDFAGIFSKGLLPLVTAVISFLICDMFDTVGTLVGTAGNNGMLDEQGNLPGGDRALIADAVGTVVGSCLGTSTVTTFVESSTGISEGARTGLANVVTGVLFLLSCFLAPVAGIIPSAATAPALVIVGVLMMTSAARIDWSDFEVSFPCFMTIAMMPFAYSITDGIAFGVVSWVVIKLVKGKAKEVSPLMYVLAVVFAAMYILSNL